MDAEPSTWQQSLSALKQLINDSSPSNSKIEKAAAAILETNSHSNDGEALPTDVHEVVQTIHLRALIGIGRFADAHQAAQNNNGDDANNVLEEAYSLYRLRRYEACRNVCARYLERSGDSERSADRCRGMMHIYAQTLYRMGETREADAIYSKIFNGKGDELDTDEKEDVLANALANRSANYTPGSLLSTKNGTPWMEQVDEITNLLQSYGTNVANANEQEMLQNYDLAYNLATYLLISSDARPRSSVMQAKHLLQHAEKSASTVLESSSQPPQDAEVEEDTKRQQQKLIAEKEAMPIKVNLAYAHLLLGGEENKKEALRMLLACVMEGKKRGTTSKGSGGGIEANLLAAASNNLALLRDGKESVFDVLKRIPVATSCSVSEDIVKGGKSAGGVASIPLVGATPQQVRTVLFNRALQLAKMGNVGGCLETLAVLRASLGVAYHGDGEGKKAPGSPKSNGKKKKSVSKYESNEITVSLQDVPTARPSSDADAVAWNARADWVESELRRVVASDENKPDGIISSAISNLDKAAEGYGSGDEGVGSLSFTKAQLLLHSAAVSNEQIKPQPIIESLQSLPPIVQSSPGTTITLASLHGVLHKAESTSRSVEIMSSLGDDVPAKLAMAEFHLERNCHDEAAKLLGSILDEDESATTDQLMSATALLVRALSYTDPEKANDYAESLREACGELEANGDELESMEIPRFAKKAGEASASTSKVRKMIASTGGKRGVAHRGQGNKKNREAILRKRAKQRDAYLKELESKGLYDPNKTTQTKPDPERWIPKSQRSYNRRGRRGRYNSNIGAQGGGAGAGMERDAQKLDVAARVAAAKSGATNGLSTANMQVSGSGPSRKGKGKRR